MTYAQSFEVALDRSSDVVRILSKGESNRRIAAKLLETVLVFQQLCHRLHCIALFGSEHHCETILRSFVAKYVPSSKRVVSTR